MMNAALDIGFIKGLNEQLTGEEDVFLKIVH
jgi:hypothetical protein